MKKFKFTLEPLYKVRVTEEKQKRGELAAAQEKLNLLIERESKVKSDRKRTESEYLADTQKGVTPLKLTSYGDYFEYIRQLLKQLAIQIERAEAKRDRIRDQLVAIMKELKALDKLREVQYEQYQAEVRLEEEKELSDILAHKQVTGE